MSSDRFDWIERILQSATKELVEAGIPNASRDARWILANHLKIAPERVMSGDPAVLGFGGMRSFQEDIWARTRGKPVSKIIHRRMFWKEEFYISESVLDPRPETETLVSEALEHPFSSVLDLGTGSGCILISLLQERRESTGVGTDISAKALAVAQRNVRWAGCSDAAELKLSDWFEGVCGTFDLIVSNPPYIAAAEMPGLQPELAYEPRMALTDEGDGLSAYRLITDRAGAFLTPNGRLLVEIGYAQGKAVEAMFRNAGFADVTVLPDLDGRDRVVSGRWRA